MNKAFKSTLVAIASLTLIIVSSGCEYSTNLPAKAEDMVMMLNEIDSNTNASMESIIKTNISNEYEAQTTESEKLMMQVCPAYATMKSLGAKHSLTDTKINMEMRTLNENKQVKVVLGDTALELIMNKDNSYMTKESFIKLMKATQEDYDEIENGIDSVLSGYDWVKAPLSEAQSFTLFEVPDGKPDDIFKNVICTTTNDSEAGKIKKYEADLVTDKVNELYKQIGLAGEVLNNMSIKLSVEYHEKDNVYYTKQITKVTDYLEIEVNSKYSIGNVDKIEIPKEKIFDGTGDNLENTANKPKQNLIGEKEKETDTDIVYKSTLRKSENQLMILSKPSEADIAAFETFFRNKANEVNNTIKDLGDFEGREPEISNEYGSLFYSRHDNGTSSSFNYYMSKTGYQALTYTKYGEVDYIKDNLNTICEKILKYSSIDITGEELSDCIDKAISLKQEKNTDRYSLTLNSKDGDYDLSIIVQDAYKADGKQTVTVETGLKCWPDNKE